MESLAGSQEVLKTAAWQRAEQEGWAPVGEFDEESGFELMAVIADVPYMYGTHNRNAAISIATDQAIASNPGGLSGAGATVGIWDQGAVRSSHQEFGGRVTVGDGSYAVNHATHAGGTLVAGGVVATAKGMAPAASLVSYDWSSDVAEMAGLAMSQPGEAGTIQVSSHSYGFISGWAPQYYPPRWYGEAGETEARNFGLYDWYCQQWDQLCASAPYYLPFKSAGNDRIDNPPAAGATYKYYDGGWKTKPYNPATDPAGDGQVNGGYDSIALIGNAKNVMTVGAVNDAVTGGSRSLSAATMTSYSGWGPADDGRVKPDIVANGSTLYSSRAGNDADYGLMSGTSMATPSAAGSAALIASRYTELLAGSHARASTLKGLIIHTADDLGTPGPDYRFGWGLMNTAAAIDLLEAHAADTEQGLIREATITSGETHTYAFNWNGADSIRVTACWTDPAGTYLYQTDSRSPRLVNDLDVRIVGPGGSTVSAFVLDPDQPAAPAGTGDNNVDNVEQVVVASPSVPGTYQVVVAADGPLSGGSQAYSLFASGVHAASAPPAVQLNAAVELRGDGSGEVILGGTVHDSDSAACDLQIECSTDLGASWSPAWIVAVSPAGTVTVDNSSSTPVESVPVDTPFDMVWGSLNGPHPVTVSDTTCIRVRAFDGVNWSEWTQTNLFSVDNQGPLTENVRVLVSDRAFNRYIVDTTITLQWEAFVASGAPVAGYYFSLNDDQVTGATFTTNEHAIVNGLSVGQDNTVYLWAVDEDGNLSEVMTFEAYVLDLDGNWDGSSLPENQQSASASMPGVVDVGADVANRIPVLRWNYEAGRQYAIETRSTLDGPGGWQPITGFKLTVHDGHVLTAYDPEEFGGGSLGFFRVISH